MRSRGKSWELEGERVDVWRANLDEQSEAFVDFARGVLSPDEHERARRFHFDQHRRRFIVGRGILRVMLGNYLGRAPQDVTFIYGPNEKPALLGIEDAALHFNVAHADAIALFAVTLVGEVGIDVERVRPMRDWQEIALRHFEPGEIARLQSCTGPEREEQFFRAWTRHEALLKAQGEGLGTVMHADALAVHPLDAAPGYVAALAVSWEARWVSNIFWQGLAADGWPITRRAAPTPLKLPDPISA